MRVWRLSKPRFAANAFDGEGARLYPGRWHPKGTRIVYCASTLSLAALEALAHFDRATAPEYVAIWVELPPDASIETLDVAALPKRWRSSPAPPALAEIGREWIASARTFALLVPSALVPAERNVLLNPAHPDMQRATIGEAEPFTFDPRLLGETTAARRKARRPRAARAR